MYMKVYRNLGAIWDFHTPVSEVSKFECLTFCTRTYVESPKDMGCVMSVSIH